MGEETHVGVLRLTERSGGVGVLHVRRRTAGFWFDNITCCHD